MSNLLRNFISIGDKAAIDLNKVAYFIKFEPLNLERKDAAYEILFMFTDTRDVVWSFGKNQFKRDEAYTKLLENFSASILVQKQGSEYD